MESNHHTLLTKQDLYHLGYKGEKNRIAFFRLFFKKRFLMFAVTILNLVPPRGIEPRSEALQATAMTTSAKAANKTGCILLVRLKV